MPHSPQSSVQELQVSSPLHIPSPQCGPPHIPQSIGQETQFSPPLQMLSPQYIEGPPLLELELGPPELDPLELPLLEPELDPLLEPELDPLELLLELELLELLELELETLQSASTAHSLLPSPGTDTHWGVQLLNEQVISNSMHALWLTGPGPPLLLLLLLLPQPELGRQSVATSQCAQEKLTVPTVSPVA
jgi:hypothetical protein